MESNPCTFTRWVQRSLKWRLSLCWVRMWSCWPFFYRKQRITEFRHVLLTLVHTFKAQTVKTIQWALSYLFIFLLSVLFYSAISYLCESPVLSRIEAASMRLLAPSYSHGVFLAQRQDRCSFPVPSLQGTHNHDHFHCSEHKEASMAHVKSYCLSGITQLVLVCSNKCGQSKARQ